MTTRFLSYRYLTAAYSAAVGDFNLARAGAARWRLCHQPLATALNAIEPLLSDGVVGRADRAKDGMLSTPMDA